jgi:hypothetical protein
LPGEKLILNLAGGLPIFVSYFLVTVYQEKQLMRKVDSDGHI